LRYFHRFDPVLNVVAVSHIGTVFDSRRKRKGILAPQEQVTATPVIRGEKGIFLLLCVKDIYDAA
jgi:hypothetical protein